MNMTIELTEKELIAIKEILFSVIQDHIHHGFRKPPKIIINIKEKIINRLKKGKV